MTTRQQIVRALQKLATARRLASEAERALRRALGEVRHDTDTANRGVGALGLRGRGGDRG